MRNYAYINNTRRTILMGRVCSCCGSPVITRVTAQAQSVARYRTSKGYEYAKDLTQAEIQKASSEVLRQIEIAKREHRRIPGTQYVDDYFHAATVFTTGVTDICPNCFSAEPWMPRQLSEKRLEELKEENFPVVFYTEEAAIGWALEWVAYTADRIAEARKAPEAVAAAQEEATALKKAIFALDARRRELPGWEKKAGLEAQREALMAQQYDIGILDFKGQRAFRENAKRIEYYLGKADEEIFAACKEIDREKARLRVRLQKALMLAYGCNGSVFVCTEGDSRSWHPGFMEDRTIAFDGCRICDDWKRNTIQAGRLTWKGIAEPFDPNAPSGQRVSRNPYDPWAMLPYAGVWWAILLFVYVWSAVSMFRDGWDYGILIVFSVWMVTATVDLLRFVKSKENRKKYAGKFYLLLIGGLMLITAVTGVVVAAVGTLAWSLSLAAVAVIPVAALLILLKMGGVKLTKLRLFTKKQKDHR